jgi:hypothetical protein
VTMMETTGLFGGKGILRALLRRLLVFQLVGMKCGRDYLAACAHECSGELSVPIDPLIVVRKTIPLQIKR